MLLIVLNYCLINNFIYAINCTLLTGTINYKFEML